VPDQHQKALFEEWLRQYGGLILRIARSYTRTDEDRDDLAQEILLQLWRSLPRFAGQASASTWIYRVALNTALAWQRSDRRRRWRQSPLVEIENIPATDTDAAARLDNEQVVARLYAAIRSLPKLDAALVLLYLDDLSYREMAEVLGISESNVGVKLNRAKKQLAELMKEVAHESR
jgi:RNA polymerase sigma-70 factor (ECF subfamily)